MPGRHASADQSRFRRDLTRLLVLALGVLVLGAALLLGIRLLAGGSEDLESPTTTEGTSATSRPTTTVTTTPTTLSTTTTTTLPTTTLPPVREPDRITVLVLNSTRVAGLAGGLTQRLSGLGYNTLEPDNHPTLLQTSVIWYVEGFDREAEVLAEQIPDANIEVFPGDDPIAALTVVLGSSYSE